MKYEKVSARWMRRKNTFLAKKNNAFQDGEKTVKRFNMPSVQGA